MRDPRESRERTRSRERRLCRPCRPRRPAFSSYSKPGCRRMEEEEEEARTLLERPPEADGAVQGAPRALPALCDPRRLAHRLVVLLLMCFLGFGEPGRAAADDGGIPGFVSPGPRCLRGLGTRSFQASRARPGDCAGDFCSRSVPECSSSSLGTRMGRNPDLPPPSPSTVLRRISER